MSTQRYHGKHFVAQDAGRSAKPRTDGILGSHSKAKVFGIALAGTALCGFGISQTIGLNVNADAEEAGDGADTSTTQQANVDSSLAYSMAATPNEKEESVYVFCNPDGSTKNTTVSTKLSNDDKSAMLKDQTSLTDLQNVESEGAYNKTDEGVVWDANEDDVYYQGTTTKEAPVKVKVSYQLDGQDIDPQDLVGKSGKVKIRFDYTNTSYTDKKINGKTERIYMPFLALTGVVLDNDNFSNVEVKNAKSVDDGDRTMVGGYAMPGFADDLDMDSDDLDISDHFTIEADVNDFKLDTTFTVVTSDIFDDAKTGKLDLSKVDKAIDALQDGMEQLIDGSGELSDGLDTLDDGAASLASGATQVKTGTSKLASGTSTLKSSTKTLPSSVKTLNKGMQSLNTGISSAASGSKTLDAGSLQLYQGLKQLKNGTSTTSGLQDAYDGITELKSAYDEQLVTPLNQAAAKYSKLIAKLKNADQSGNAVIDSYDAIRLKVYVKTIDDTLDSIDEETSKIDELENQLEELKSTKKDLAKVGSDAKALATATGTAYSVLSQVDNADIAASDLSTQDKKLILAAKTAVSTDDATSAVSDMSENGSTYSADLQTLNTKLSDIKINILINELKTIKKDLKALEEDVPSLTSDVDDFYNSIKDLDSTQFNKLAASYGTKLESAVKGVNEVSTSLGIIANGSNGQAINGKTSAGLSGALAGLGSESDSSTLIGGAYALNKGLDSLTSGLNTAYTGSSKLAAGTKKLNAAAPKLYKGVTKLNKGAQTLKKGTVSLSNGANKLSKGATSAAKGARALKKGLEEYNEKGIQKIADIYNDKVAGLGDRLDAVIDSGKDYDNFTGITKGTKGSVKFIYETDALGEDD
ncbi:MAG: hypothetical protein ACOX69_09010 [Coriobacteriales bacterium]|jgi:putative membrane protein